MGSLLPLSVTDQQFIYSMITRDRYPHMQGWIRGTQSQIEMLRKADSTFRLFGAFTHQYQLGPRMSERDVAAAEAKYGITLPDDYRIFLIELGNGGAGPGYGLQRFGFEETAVARNSAPARLINTLTSEGHPVQYTCSAFDDMYYDEMDRLRSNPRVLAKPFPLVRPWKSDNETVSEDDGEYSRWRDDVWEPMFEHGSFQLSDHGCGMKDKLIVSGEESGSIWKFDEQDGEWIVPFGANVLSEHVPKARHTFSMWYNEWLSNSLYQVNGLTPHRQPS
ncbi:MAG: SMI1/KNR4 family protein [Planctomycetia bacterium]|nr:SMI1/KNR4 family protein [Planctomycetia bacterium]